MKHFPTIIVLAFLFAGCTATPKLADYKDNPNGMWLEGKKLTQKGEKLVRSGEEDIESARVELNKGQMLVDSGTNTITNVRYDYQLEIAKIGRATSPKEVKYESDRLKAVSEKWEKAISNITKGNKTIAKSKRLQSEGQKQVDEGRKLVTQGSNFIRNSQVIQQDQSASKAVVQPTTY